MAQRETGKQRASRIPLDYYKRPDKLHGWKTMLAILAAIAAICWFAGSALSSAVLRRPATAQYSHGDLASVHATWDTQCSACHEEFPPLHGSFVASARQEWSNAADQKCQSCHMQDGGPHSALEKQEEVGNCASCHHDHRGRDADLTRMADYHCTRCHANLDDHTHAGSGLVASLQGSRVTGFGADPAEHPKFNLPAVDPGTIKFSHWHHMNPGIMPSGTLAKAPLTWAQLPAEERKALQGAAADSDVVHLQCASCHQLNAAPGASGLVAAWATGDLMQPINFESHCKLCHPLQYEAGSASKTIAHGQTTAQMQQWILAGYAAEAMGDAKSQLSQLLNRARPLPNQKNDSATGTNTLGQDLQKFRDKAEKHLKTRCGQCHTMVAAGNSGAFDVAPPGIKQVWLESARFDHTAHRAVDCLACHADAGVKHDTPPSAAEIEGESKKVMIPNMETCTQCHAPASHTAAGMQGGARHDCVECHQYHGGDHASRGPGSLARGVAERKQIGQFLTGP